MNIKLSLYVDPEDIDSLHAIPVLIRKQLELPADTDL